MYKCIECKYYCCYNNAHRASINFNCNNIDGIRKNSENICFQMGNDTTSFYEHSRYSNNCMFFKKANKLGFLTRLLGAYEYKYPYKYGEPYFYNIDMKWNNDTKQWELTRIVKNYNINIEYLNPFLRIDIGNYFHPYRKDRGKSLHLTNSDIPIELNCTESTKTKVTRPIPEILEELDEAVDSRDDICTQTQEN